MYHLVHLLSTIKLGLQHKVLHVRCQTTQFNDLMLDMFIALGLIENYGPCSKYRYKRIITLNQTDGLLKSNLDGYIRSLSLTSVVYSQMLRSSFEILIVRSRPFVVSVRTLRRWQQQNEMRTCILSTTSGLLTQKEALRRRLGGILICRFF